MSQFAVRPRPCSFSRRLPWSRCDFVAARVSCGAAAGQRSADQVTGGALPFTVPSSATRVKGSMSRMESAPLSAPRDGPMDTRRGEARRTLTAGAYKHSVSRVLLIAGPRNGRRGAGVGVSRETRVSRRDNRLGRARDGLQRAAAVRYVRLLTPPGKGSASECSTPTECFTWNIATLEQRKTRPRCRPPRRSARALRPPTRKDGTRCRPSDPSPLTRDGL